MKSVVFLPQTTNETDLNISFPHRLLDLKSVELQSDKENHNDPNEASDNCVLFDLPNILLTNVQSFGKSGKTDKTTELELVLELNNIDVGVFTETWATDTAIKSLEFDQYTMFHSIRDKCHRASGGLSIFVKNTFPAKKIDIAVPDHL